MSGNKYLLDTNAVYSLLKGNKKINKLLEKSSWTGVSIITKLEVFSFPGLPEQDLVLFTSFFKEIEIIDVANKNDELLQLVFNLRIQKKLLLPDAIIAATAIQLNSKLITGDTLFKKISSLEVIGLK